jgi:hypothetical protein
MSNEEHAQLAECTRNYTSVRVFLVWVIKSEHNFAKVNFRHTNNPEAGIVQWYMGSRGIAPRILDLGTRWELSASRPGRFTPRERAPGTHWTGG